MEVKTGMITHYFNKIGVAVLDLVADLEVGDEIHILGHTTDFIQEISSMEINHQKIDSAGPGDDVALKVIKRVREGDEVFKIVEK
jgi:putative protease